MNGNGGCANIQYQLGLYSLGYLLSSHGKAFKAPGSWLLKYLSDMRLACV